MRSLRFTMVVVVAYAGCSWLPGVYAQEQKANTSKEKQATSEAGTQPRFNVEKKRQEAEVQAKQSLDKEAVAAIEETRKAIKAIADKDFDTAVAGLERATGKINILVARNPATALIPVDSQVEAIVSAPAALGEIKERAGRAERAFANKDYPTARLILGSLMSEVRVRTISLPLASYPAALKEAARLLDQKKDREALAVLKVALNTLVVVDHVTPLPIAFADSAIEEAQELRDKDKNKALDLLNVARRQLEIAKELGYAGNDPEYATLTREISNLERQLDDGKQDTASAFSKLKDAVASFFKRQSDSERR